MFSLFVFIIGLCFGSFVNVLVWRLPKGKTLLGRSICDKCKKQIAWYDNIPLLSFFLLGRKCRNCKASISIQYPLVELSTALFFVIGFYFLPFEAFVPFALLTPILISIFLIDVKYQIIPDELIIAGLTVAVFFYPVFTGFFAGFSAASILLLLHLITKGRGMGLGDVKFAVLGGFVSGSGHFVNWLFTAFLTGAMVGVILILSKNAKLKDKIAFGPFLVLALFAVLLFGI